MTKIHVIEGEKTLNNYNKEKDLDVALEILKIATLGGYRDIEWAIRDYEKKNKNNPNRPGAIPQITTPPPIYTPKPRLAVNKDEIF